MLTPQWLDQLRARTTLSALIGRSTRLQKAGREFKACCPFHNEKSPSFTVNDEKGFYHCFGCGAHGDAIRWMTDHQGLSFMDAVKELAAEAGMDVPAPDPRAAKAAEKRDTLHDVMADAQAWFVSNLSSPGGEAARGYLATRGFDAHTLQRFGFGYAPEGRQAMKEALGKFPEAMLIEAGLRIEVENRDPYDRFRGRLMLPIEDARGRVIAFGGRILTKEKTEAPKYLNSPDTPLFDKGRTLYNLHRAAPAARQSGRMVVVEGYMDVVAMAAAGIGECVAPLGTALTEHQIEMLWRHVEMPVLCFDGDAAGQRAAMRAVTRALPLLRPAHSLRIVRLPEGMDPDDLIKAKGARAMEDILGTAKSLVDVLWEVERDAQPLTTPEDKAGLKARLMEHVDAIQHPDIASLYRRELQDRYSEFAFPKRESRWQQGDRGQSRPGQWNQRGGGGGRGNFQKGRWSPLPESDPESLERLRKAASGGARDGLSAAVLAGLIRWPDQIARHAEALARTPGLDPRFSLLLDCYDVNHHAKEPLVSEALATILSNSGLEIPGTAEYSGLRFGFLNPDASADQAAEDLVQAVDLLVERPVLEAALAQATSRFESELSDEAFAEQQRLLKRKLEFDSRLRQMATRQAASS
ncbi:DNA primase [Novosphingobium sp. PhB165]|uniref:DNA primase n=1 Tax=Novosphingobium sp. PhB165 TaxID=2485105 RepID=UPI00104EAE31|nr:DNA primase [Novosphingobium sp. PhB165]TCM21983.1 DNA primase [Novosphingobium sp. PhB165]